MGGGAVVRAGDAHGVVPGEAGDDHAVGEEEVDELEEGGFDAARAGVAGGEGGASFSGEFARLPEVAAVVEPVFELACHAAPVR